MRKNISKGDHPEKWNSSQQGSMSSEAKMGGGMRDGNDDNTDF